MRLPRDADLFRDVAADSNDAFASVLSEGRGETDVIVEIEFGEALQILR